MAFQFGLVKTRNDYQLPASRNNYTLFEQNFFLGKVFVCFDKRLDIKMFAKLNIIWQQTFPCCFLYECVITCAVQCNKLFVTKSKQKWTWSECVLQIFSEQIFSFLPTACYIFRERFWQDYKESCTSFFYLLLCNRQLNLQFQFVVMGSCWCCSLGCYRFKKAFRSRKSTEKSQKHTCVRRHFWDVKRSSFLFVFFSLGKKLLWLWWPGLVQSQVSGGWEAPIQKKRNDLCLLGTGSAGHATFFLGFALTTNKCWWLRRCSWAKLMMMMMSIATFLMNTRSWIVHCFLYRVEW